MKNSIITSNQYTHIEKVQGGVLAIYKTAKNEYVAELQPKEGRWCSLEFSSLNMEAAVETAKATYNRIYS